MTAHRFRQVEEQAIRKAIRLWNGISTQSNLSSDINIPALENMELLTFIPIRPDIRLEGTGEELLLCKVNWRHVHANL